MIPSDEYFHIVVIGNPSDGFRFVGPFKDQEAQAEYVASIDDDWWFTSLENPGGDFV